MFIEVTQIGGRDGEDRYDRKADIPTQECKVTINVTYIESFRSSTHKVYGADERLAKEIPCTRISSMGMPPWVYMNVKESYDEISKLVSKSKKKTP